MRICGLDLVLSRLERRIDPRTIKHRPSATLLHTDIGGFVSKLQPDYKITRLHSRVKNVPELELFHLWLSKLFSDKNGLSSVKYCLHPINKNSSNSHSKIKIDVPEDDEVEFTPESKPSRKIANNPQQEQVTTQSADTTSRVLKVNTQKSMKDEQNRSRKKIGRVGNILVEVTGGKKRSGCSSTIVKFVLHGQRRHQDRDERKRTSESVNRLNGRKYATESTPEQKLGEIRDSTWGDYGESNLLEYEDHHDEKITEDFGDITKSAKRKRNNKEWARKCASTSTCNKRARPRSLSPKQMRINDPESTSDCPCKRNQLSSVSWYEPIICPCDYEKEARNYTDLQGSQHRVMADEDFMDNLDNILNDIDNDKPPSGLKNSPPTRPRRSISPETWKLLKSVENPKVLDSISRRGLNHEFEHGLTDPPTLPSTSHHTEDNRSLQAAPVSTKKEDSKVQQQVSPPARQSSPRNTEQLSNTNCPTIVYYPVTQLPYFSTQPLPTPTQVMPENLFPSPLSIVPTNNVFTQVCTPGLSTHQFLPFTQVFGSYIIPSVNPTILQPTLYIPRGPYPIRFC